MAPRAFLRCAAMLALAGPLGGCIAADRVQDWWQREQLDGLTMMKMELAEERRHVEELDALMVAQTRGLQESAQAITALRAGLKAGQPAPPEAPRRVAALEAKHRALESRIRISEPTMRQERLASIRRHNGILAEARAVSNRVRPEWRVDSAPLK